MLLQYPCLSSQPGPNHVTTVSNEKEKTLNFADRALKFLGWLGGYYTRKAVSSYCSYVYMCRYRILSKIADTLIVRTPQLFISLIKLDSRKIEGFSLSNTCRYQGCWNRLWMLECWLVKWSSTEWNKEGREAHEVISTSSMLFWNDLSPAWYRVCCLSLMARRNSDI